MAGRESHHELEGEDHDHDDFTSFVVEPASFPSMEALRHRVGAAVCLPGVLRIKGRVRVDGKPVPAVVQAVGPRVEAYFEPVAGPARLVVIGLRDIDPAVIAASLTG